MTTTLQSFSHRAGDFPLLYIPVLFSSANCNEPSKRYTTARVTGWDGTIFCGDTENFASSVPNLVVAIWL